MQEKSTRLLADFRVIHAHQVEGSDGYKKQCGDDVSTSDMVW